MLTYPNIDPIALDLGFFVIRWYSLAYIFGIIFGWMYAGRMNRVSKFASAEQFDKIITWIVLGIVLGGRFGYVLFYKPGYYIYHPHEIFYMWEGGMSFHGGMIGCILALYIFCRREKIAFFPFMDVAAAVSTIGILFGRLANFINGELYGRPTDSAFGMIFPNSDGVPRHPSQLYEGFSEGLLMFIILSIMFWKFKAYLRPRLLSGMFLILYGISRIIVEFFREPDAHLGYIGGFITMGQILCIPMLMLGSYLVFKAYNSPKRVVK